jgi:hypothetical protein
MLLIDCGGGSHWHAYRVHWLQPLRFKKTVGCGCIAGVALVVIVDRVRRRNHCRAVECARTIARGARRHSVENTGKSNPSKKEERFRGAASAIAGIQASVPNHQVEQVSVAGFRIRFPCGLDVGVVRRGSVPGLNSPVVSPELRGALAAILCSHSHAGSHRRITSGA